MKRFVTLALIIAMGMTLTACKSRAVKEVEKAVSSIGVVTADSGSLLCAAEELYNKLSEEERVDVSNLETLETARKEYEKQAEAKLSELIKNRAWSDAQNYLEGIDAQTIASLQNSIVNNLGKSLSDFEKNPCEAETLNAGLNIMELVGAGKDEYGQRVIDVLVGLQDLLKEINLWQDYEQLKDLHNQNITTFTEQFLDGNYTEKISAINRMDSYVSAIAYDGTEENALRYISALKEIRDGMNTVKTGLEEKDDALIKAGIDQMHASTNKQIQVLEENISSIRKRIILLQAATDLGTK